MRDRAAFMDGEVPQGGEFRALEEIADDLAGGVVQDQAGGTFSAAWWVSRMTDLLKIPSRSDGSAINSLP